MLSSSPTPAIHSYPSPFPLLAWYPTLFSLNTPSRYQSITSAVIDLFIYLIIILEPKSCQCGIGAHQRQEKREEGKTSEKCEEKGKGSRHGGRNPLSYPGKLALREENEQNGKHKKSIKKETRSGSPTRLGDLLTTSVSAELSKNKGSILLKT